MQLIDINFGEYLPDIPEFRNPGATVATNVIPRATDYGQFPGLSVYSSNAADARVRGVFTARDKDGNVYTYAGDGTKIYSVVDTAFANVSKSGNYTLATDDFWEFTQFGNQVIGVSFSIATQELTLGGANFADLITSTLKPKARRIATVRDFVVLGNTTDATDGSRPQRVWWSGIGDPTDFDPLATTQCDFEDLSGPNGWIQKIAGGEFGSIFMEKAIYRMTYEGGDTIFRFDEVVSNRGTVEGNSVIKVGRLMPFLDADGFYLFDGTDVVPIGKDKVDRTFWNEIDPSFVSRVSVAYDPSNGVFLWAYPASGNNGIPNRILMFNPRNGRWSKAEVDCEMIYSDLTKGYTLDSLDSLIPDIDDTTVSSLDSRLLTGGTPILAAVNPSHQLAYFNGDALDAVMETGEIQPFNGLRTFVGEVRPLVDGTGATTTIQIGTRELHTSANSFGSALSLDGMGKINSRISARYMRFRANITGGFDHAQGVQIKARQAGLR